MKSQTGLVGPFCFQEELDMAINNNTGDYKFKVNRYGRLELLVKTEIPYDRIEPGLEILLNTGTGVIVWRYANKDDLRDLTLRGYFK
jgi:hypothetical protein